MERTLRLLITAFLLSVSTIVFAQDRGWDSVLDRYEQICRTLADLRSRMQSGESIPVDSLSTVTAELSALRRDMDRDHGQMTALQRHRMESIGEMYRSGAPMPSFYKIERLNWTATSPSLEITQRGEDSRISDLKGLQYSFLPIAVPYYAEDRFSVNSGKEPNFSILADVAVIPDVSYGIMLSYSFGKDGTYGIFLKGRSNFRKSDYSYDCKSDGSSDKGYIWTTGKSSVIRLQLTAGALLKVLPVLSVYGGAGYGDRTLCWEETDGNWARVSDRSSSGVSLDAGIVLQPFSGNALHGLLIESGIGFIPAGKYLDWTIGIGWSF